MPPRSKLPHDCRKLWETRLSNSYAKCGRRQAQWVARSTVDDGVGPPADFPDPTDVHSNTPTFHSNIFAFPRKKSPVPEIVSVVAETDIR